MNFQCKFRHAVRFLDPDFLVDCKISAIWRRFPLIIALYIFWMCAIFLLPVSFTYWPRKYTTRVDPHVDNSHQVWSWYVHTLPSYSVFCLLIRYVTLWPWPLTSWPWTVAVHGGSRDQPCYQVRRPHSYPFLVTHWLPLKMRARPLRMRRITWPVSRGSKTITFLESPTPICLFTIQLRWLYDEYN